MPALEGLKRQRLIPLCSSKSFSHPDIPGVTKGMNPALIDEAEALREAKRWMITRVEHPDPDGKSAPYNHPFFWTPFILIGEPR
jgi:CHAT domain